MPDPAFAGTVTNTTYANRTNTTVTAPSGITDGDILFFAHFAASSGTGTKSVTAPSGFTAVPLVSGTWPLNINDGSFGASIRLWYKVASGESGNYTATHAALSTQGVMWRVSAGDATNLLARLNSGTSGSAADSTALSMTTTNNGALVGVIGWDWADTTNNLTGPSGTTPTFTERLDVTLTGLWTGNLATAGATGDKTFANNTNDAVSQNPWAAVMFVVEPVVGGGTTYNESPSDSLTPSEAVAKSVGKTRGDTLGATEAFLKSVNRTVADSVVLSEGFLKSVSKPLADSVVLTENFLAAKVLLRGYDDTLSTTEGFLKQANKSVAETAVLTETFVKTAGKAVGDSVSLTEGLTILKARFLNLGDTLGVTEALTKFLSKITGESVTLTEPPVPGGSTSGQPGMSSSYSNETPSPSPLLGLSAGLSIRFACAASSLPTPQRPALSVFFKGVL